MSNQKSSMVTDLTNGSVTKLLLRFAFPLFISNALQAVYNIVDMIVVVLLVILVLAIIYKVKFT